MDAAMAMRPLLLLPEMLLFVGGLVVLVAGSFTPRGRQWRTRAVAVSALAAAAVAAGVVLAGPDRTAFEGTFAVDTAIGAARILVTAGTLLVVLLAIDEIRGSPRESETYALLLFSATGVLVLAGALDLLVVAVGLLLATIPMYGLIGIVRTTGAAEATMKAYLLGSLFSILLLLGVAILSALADGSGYAALGDRLADAPTAALAAGGVSVLAGLMFKAGGIPGHYWVPDAAQGAAGAVAAYVTTVPKIGALIAAYRLVDALSDTLAWPVLVGVLAVASMTLGNLAAYGQHDPRRLLGWSTVSQVGYLLVPVAVAGRSDLALPSLLLYLAGYVVTNVAAFAVTTALPEHREIGVYRGLAGLRPWLGGGLLVVLLGLVGTPPTAVFVGKVTVAAAAWDADHAWLAIALVANTVASLFYYLRWIMPAYQHGKPDPRTPPRAFAPLPWSAGTAVAGAGLSLALGIGAGIVWALVEGPVVL